MKRNKCKLLILASIMAISMASFGLSNKNVAKMPSKPDAMDTNKKAGLTISKAELDVVAEKIFKNEAGGKKEDLVYWNTGEDFPSLGIGHFIWYKQGQRGRFAESFPQLVAYYRKHDIKLPKIVEENSYSPWESREELFKLRSIGNKDIVELTNFLYNTKAIQVSFIFERLENSLEKMLEIADNPENVKKQFYRVAHSPNGLYPLIDYVNFKGEGTSRTETYNGDGWGLLQVLENMKGTGSGKAALEEFSDSAKFVLERRVKNSDPARNEKKWLAGWLNRCNTYKN
ncbi:hypothetical protein JMUB4039_0053 [Leptotrichia trevisanii]|jgi:hypothetical protein|uniref:Uncharacterized protein n=1 Tax=Leptotrichia trevisanii TaxID=109328 RepID=A0A510KHI1_9FUSO|nr:hypothetical protein [Leptotrichia trevisanii]BBM51104.1 hypothetical protein JMUB3935_0053 [Leptotrichia trevisanii]BBM56104.1 hypothetical protein JMUB4039_0053 [Leptotrichia trevisanii]